MSVVRFFFFFCLGSENVLLMTVDDLLFGFFIKEDRVFGNKLDIDILSEIFGFNGFFM